MVWLNTHGWFKSFGVFNYKRSWYVDA